MSWIGGIFLFDAQPVAPVDADRLRQLGEHRACAGIQVSGAAGMLMAHAASRFDFPPPGGPAETQDGNACVWDGRLDNFSSVLLRLGRDAARQPVTPAMAALQIYQTGGTAGLRHLIGDWSLAIWDARSRAVVLASDYAGSRPLYYHRGADRVVWSSSLEHLVRWTGCDTLDEEYAARFLCSRVVPRLTPYAGIRSVPPGRALRMTAMGTSEEIFWRLPARQDLRLEDDRDYEEALRGHFRDAVQARVSGAGAVCAELSGGLDSSSVVCLAERLMAPERKPFTFSYTHEGCRDLPYIRAVEQACGTESTHFDLNDCPLVTADQAGGAAPAWWQPRLAATARRMEELGAGVLLTGQLGDFVMGNLGDDSEQVADLLQARRYGAAVREAFAWSQYLQLPFYTIFGRAMRTTWTSWTAPPISDAFTGPEGEFTRQDSLMPKMRTLLAAAGPALDEAGDWQEVKPSRRRRFQMLSHSLEGRVLQVPESMQHLAYTHPYTHRPLVEFMLTIPPEKVCRPGEMRRLMRRAFAPFLPPAIVKRKSKAVYTGPFRDALVGLAHEVLTAKATICTVEAGYLEQESFLARLKRFTQGLDCNEFQLRQALLLEFWLRKRERRQPLQGSTTSTIVPLPGELETEKVAPI